MDDRPGEPVGSHEDDRGCPACTRRRLLGGLGTGALAGLAGCRDVLGERSPTSTPAEPADGGTATGSPTATDTSLAAYRDVELPVPEEEMFRGTGRDTIAAITDPAFGPDWGRADIDLVDTDQVIGVLEPQTGSDGTATASGEGTRRARAYPLPVLNWHEVVNDEFGVPLLVSFCPLCGSGVVADRVVDGRTLTFGVSGLLWESDLVMYDVETDSLWSQLLAQAINGELTGTRLRLRPSTLTTWGQWKASHPDTEVLLPSPISVTVRGRIRPNYERNPYVSYTRSERIGVGENDGVDDRLHPKTRVIGIANGGVARAYPLTEVVEAGVVNDTVGGLPVVVVALDTTLVAYVRRIDGRVLTFERDGEALLAGGSRWDPLAGRALDGPFEGRELAPANDRSPMFWFAWADFFPGTEIYEAG